MPGLKGFFCFETGSNCAVLAGLNFLEQTIKCGFVVISMLRGLHIPWHKLVHGRSQVLSFYRMSSWDVNRGHQG